MLRKVSSASLILLVLPCFVRGEEPVVQLPERFAARPGLPVQLTAKTNGKTLRWVSLSEDLALFPYLENTAIAISPLTGSYRVLCYTALGDTPSSPAFTVIVVGAPGPVPPAPPVPPVPPPPGPVDPFVAQLRAAISQEADPGKVSQVTQLASIYRQAAQISAPDPQFSNLGQLYTAVRQAALKLLPSEALPVVRAAVQGYLAGQLPTDATTALDASLRARVASTFQAVASALDTAAKVTR